MPRSSPTKTMLILVLLLICGSLAFKIIKSFVDSKITEPKYNLILISVDTLRSDRMGVYGYPQNTTPNIDKWAKNAVVFSNTRAEIPQTYPSFATLMTGKSSFETNIFANSILYEGNPPRIIPINDQNSTIAEILKRKGYKTAAFLNSPALDPRYTRINGGFDTFSNNFLSKNLTGPGKQEQYKSYKNVVEGIKWLKKNKDDKFFLWIHLMEPHAPYLPIDEFKCKFNKKFCPTINKTDLETLESLRYQYWGVCNPQIPKNTAELIKTLYDGGVASADKLTSMIFDAIEKERLNDNTIVVFYGDHGEGFDHSYYFMHGSQLYDSNIKIPFIIKHPAINPARVNLTLSNTNLYDLILNLLKEPQEKHPIDRILNNIKKNKYLFSASVGRTKYAVQEGNFKYIYTFPNRCMYKNQPEELYNLDNDPQELKNIIMKETNTAARLKDTLSNRLKKFSIPESQMIWREKSDIDPHTLEELKSLGY